MTAHEDLATAIDEASDNGHEQKLLELVEECLKRLEDAADIRNRHQLVRPDRIQTIQT